MPSILDFEPSTTGHPVYAEYFDVTPPYSSSIHVQTALGRLQQGTGKSMTPTTTAEEASFTLATRIHPGLKRDAVQGELNQGELISV